MVANAVFISEITGVIPLPALNAITSRSSGPRRKKPAGRATSTMLPGVRWSWIQVDAVPPGTFFTVTRNSSSTAGAEDIE